MPDSVGNIGIYLQIGGVHHPSYRSPITWIRPRGVFSGTVILVQHLPGRTEEPLYAACRSKILLVQPEQALLIQCLADTCSSNSLKPCLDSRKCFPSQKYPRTQVLLRSSQETPAVRDILTDSSRCGMEIFRMAVRRAALNIVAVHAE